MGCSVRTKKCLVFGIGVGLAVIAGVLAIAWPAIFNSILKQQLALSKGSKSYEMWVETPIPMYLELYLYNWSNYDAFSKDKTKKPKFVEMGPYVFAEKHYKQDIVWNNNDTVTFWQNRTWHFLPEKSGGELSDKIVNLNVITATVGYTVRNKHKLIRRAVDWILNEKGEGLITTRTARELLFDGYEDKLIDMVHDLNVTGFNIPYDKFGWFYPRNNSLEYDGVFNMYTGADSLKNTGILDQWNYMTQTPFYEGKCGLVTGTTGELWPPIKNSKQITMYISDFCRSVSLDYSGTYEKLGIVGSKFIGTEEVFDNGSIYPAAACYSTGDIVPSGTLNVSLCRFGAPAFVSYPHFFLADESYRNDIEGMHPNESEHRMFIALEPVTGIPLEVQAQLQINIMIEPYDGIKIFDIPKRMFFPMLWFRQTASLTGDLADQAKLVVLVPDLGNYTFIGMGAIGLLIIIIGIIVSVRGGWGHREGQLLLRT